LFFTVAILAQEIMALNLELILKPFEPLEELLCNCAHIKFYLDNFPLSFKFFSFDSFCDETIIFEYLKTNTIIYYKNFYYKIKDYNFELKFKFVSTNILNHII
jgi:hypothetical protein